MIVHVSLPADDCALVARVLAELLDGGALPFPPGGPTTWNVWSRANDCQIVVLPRGQVMVAGPCEQVWAQRPRDPADRASESHCAIAGPRPASEVVALATAVGWVARVCDRGGFFTAVEVWVENAYLVELLDPDQLAAYRRSMTVDTWREAFAIT